jgi:EmrB/QacA subfamily drug resistance transporter
MHMTATPTSLAESDPELAPTPGQTAPASPWPVFFTASVAVFLVSIDSTVLFAAFKSLLASFPGHGAADASWVLNAYTVVYAALLVPAGRLSDSYGRKRIFMLGVGLFTLASLACGLAPSLSWLVAARVLQAMGAAMLTPASLAIVLAAFPAEKRAVAVSLWGAVGGLAAAIGPSLGSFLVDSMGWRWAFFINLPPALWSLWRASTRLTDAPRSSASGRMDLPGLAMLIFGVSALTWTVVRTESQGWQSGQTWGGLGLGLFTLWMFTRWARHTPQPALDMRLFDNPSYRAVNLATLVFGIAFAMMFFGFFFFMTGIWHYSLPLAGLAITPGPLMVIPAAVIAGRIAAKAGHRPLLITGCALLALGGLWQSFIPGWQPQYLTHWLPSQLLTGIGVGITLPSLAGAAVASLPPQQFGEGSAVNQAVRQFGTVLGVAFTVVLVGHAALTLADFRTLTLSYAALALLTALICLGVNTRPRT